MHHSVAIIGFGKMGKIRKNIFDTFPDCEVKWVCDIAPVSGDFRFIEDAKEVFNDSETDIIFIATPNYRNKDLIVQGLNSNKHVFCEKPIGISSAQVLEIIAAEKSNPQLKFMAGFKKITFFKKMLGKSKLLIGIDFYDRTGGGLQRKQAYSQNERRHARKVP